MIQGSTEWFAARVGKVTASRVADVFAKPRKDNAVSAVREAYMADLLAERITGVPTVRFGGDEAAMAWGRQTEAFARAAYEEGRDSISAAGFVDHPRILMSGASPDGLMLDEGMVEIKCPNTKTHEETIRLNRVPPKYLPQIKWGLACTERKWCDFISFDPRCEGSPLFVSRVFAVPAELRAMEMGVIAFLLELEARVAEHQGEAA